MAYNPGGGPGPGFALPAPVNPAFCVPYVAQFVIDEKILKLRVGQFVIKDAQGTLLFDVKATNLMSFHTKRLLRDASGNPLVLLKNKIATMHEKWHAFRGDSDSDSNLIFTIGKKSMFQFRPAYEIFLAGNNSSNPDFTVQGNFIQRNYSILHNGTPIAEARQKLNAGAIFLGRDNYTVTVFPGADHAFVAAVVVIVHEVKEHQRNDGLIVLAS